MEVVKTNCFAILKVLENAHRRLSDKTQSFLRVFSPQDLRMSWRIGTTHNAPVLNHTKSKTNTKRD